MIGSEERWFATARTATKPENMQGFHEDYMLFVCDEASGIAILLWKPYLVLYLVQKINCFVRKPNKNKRCFYDSHNRDRDLYKIHKVSSLDSPRTSKDNIEVLKKK